MKTIYSRRCKDGTPVWVSALGACWETCTPGSEDDVLVLKYTGTCTIKDWLNGDVGFWLPHSVMRYVSDDSPTHDIGQALAFLSGRA